MRQVIMVVLTLALAQVAIADYTYILGPGEGIDGRLDLYGSESILLQGGAVKFLNLHESSYGRIEASSFVQGMSIWDNSRLDLIDGFVMSTLNIFGGYLDMTGGQIGDMLGAAGGGTVSISGGTVKILSIGGSTNVELSGGAITFMDGGTLVAPDINIICKDYAFNPVTYRLSGTWADNTAFAILIRNKVPGYDILPYVHFTIVPEPLTLGLMCFGSLFAHRWRQR